MTNKFKKKVQYHSKGSLILRPDVKGAKMWSVALKNTMFTYFSIDPESSFERHSHPSEQITMVLEGQLFFELTERIICLKKGEVIAIPSNIPHAVFTKDSSVIAVDAWSPIHEKYIEK
jgi:quercetin dioxygenase-like cupin family protein